VSQLDSRFLQQRAVSCARHGKRVEVCVAKG
jgi:hypothetical protein